MMSTLARPQAISYMLKKATPVFAPHYKYHQAFSMNLPFSLRWLAKPNGAEVEGVKLTCQLLFETTLCLHMMLRLKECFSSYFRTEF